MPCAKQHCRAFLVTNHAPPQIVSGYENISSADHIIAVDNGLQQVHALGLQPHIIIGDLDSLALKLLDLYPAVPIHKHPSAKNETDTELALLWCLKQEIYTEIIICNDLQGRFDHALGLVQNLLLAKSFSSTGSAEFPLRIESQRQILFTLPDTLTLNNRRGQLVSLIPLSAEVQLIHSTGLKYPLDNLVLSSHLSRGISNEIIAPQAVICKAKGEALVVLSP
ncbi:MAG: thiamine diphosphokinase [Candidatus Cloacimonas sp.]|jgi:thiamine pyrophosphokinase|nr:thiamine diphosphokinase [Candidatus Cloacimonas sp.]